jgi:glycosyltransferase involved in cell wall biosynthesis
MALTRPTTLHVVTSTDRRGAETFGVMLRDALAARGQRGDVVALVPGRGDRPLPVPVLGPSRVSPRGLLRLRRLCRRADVVVAHGSSTLPACAVATAASRTPFVYVNIGDPRYWSGTRCRRLRVRLLLGRAARIAAISRRSADILVGQYGVRLDRVRVIPNGRDSAPFLAADRAAGERLRAGLGIAAGTPVVLALGALSAEKRVDLAVQAVVAVPDTRLLVAGSGPEEAALRRLADQLAPGRVHFLGAVTDVPSLLAAVDAVVLASDSEGLPGVLIEAGMAGVPAVATDVGWVADVVVDGVTGVLVPRGRADVLADGLRRVLAHREEMGAAARTTCVERFDLGTVTEAWAGLLGELAGERERVAP